MDLLDVLTHLARGASLGEVLALSLALLSALWGAAVGGVGLARAGWRAGRAALAWARKPSRLSALEGKVKVLWTESQGRRVVE